MKQVNLDRIAPLLDVLRRHPALSEVRPNAFHLDGRDFVHFHELADEVHADVRLSTRVVRLPVTTESQQAELLEQIEHSLASLGDHARDRARRGKRRRRAHARS